MEKFSQHTGVGVPLRRSNVDTDQIIPAVWLKKVTRDGFEEGLFSAWRSDPSFVLNQDAYKNATVLVAGPTSAPAHRVSTQSGRCRTTASRSSSRLASATSSAATPARPGCWRRRSTTRSSSGSGTTSTPTPGRRSRSTSSRGRSRPATASTRSRTRSRSTTTRGGASSRDSTTSASRWATRTRSRRTRRPGRRSSPRPSEARPLTRGL